MKTKLKNGFKKVRKWIKKHKVLTVFLILAAVVIGIYFRLQRAGQEMAEALSQMAFETGEVSYRDITSTVNATGYVRSDNSRSLTTTLMNLEVTGVNVEVGDKVSVGQALVSFDTEDIEENLADARESLNVSQAQSGLTVKGAERNLADAVGSRDYQITGAMKDLDYSKTTYEDAVADYHDTVKELEEKRKEEEDRKRDRDDREKDMDRAKDRLEKAWKEQSGSGLSPDLLDQINEGTVSGNEILENIAGAFDTGAVTAAQAEYQTASADYSAAAADYEKAKAEREALESSVDAKKTAMDANYRTYDRAADTFNNTVRMQNSAVAGSQDSLTNSRLSATIGSQAQENQVETYEKQLEKGILTSPINGTVTAVNVKEGDTYGGGVIVTIQDCEDFIVEAEIDEYDISDIKEGMKVLFKTDATREEQLEGEVTFVSPVPTSAAASSSAMGSGSATSLTTGGGKATYQIKVAIRTATDRLRLGMTAKMNIVLNEVEHVLTVPYDAVQTDENGDTVVYVLEQTMDAEGKTTQEQRPVAVTVGTEGDYYVEVSGDGLEEGMKVAIPKEEAVDLMELMMTP
ncbi:MAG: HlyD family efflux transporter periplasmic adaptor subunit [Lachnospiraceae bacterium]|nr:HlyD family efflux transporter periplasmic adaptor subunit [Lachnospiraceae bacterium]